MLFFVTNDIHCSTEHQVSASNINNGEKLEGSFVYIKLIVLMPMVIGFSNKKINCCGGLH